MIKKPAWAIQQIVRETGLIENICCHNIGHPDPDSAKRIALFHKEWEQGHCTKQEAISAWRVHGCDGCCSEKTRKSDGGMADMVKKGLNTARKELLKKRYLVRSREEFFVALRSCLKSYDAMLAIKSEMVKVDPAYDPLEKTLRSYDDFWEWLQGDL